MDLAAKVIELSKFLDDEAVATALKLPLETVRDILKEVGNQDEEIVEEEFSPNAERFLQYIDAQNSNSATVNQIKVCVTSPRATGITFVSANLAYCLSAKYKVALVGEDCRLYIHKLNNINVYKDNKGVNNEEIVIIDTHTAVSADIVVLVYSPDLYYIAKVWELDQALSTRKIRVLNKNVSLPISIPKLLGFEPDVVIPAINNSRQVLLGRPAVMDYPDISQALQKIVLQVEREMINHGKNRLPKHAVLSSHGND